MFRSLIRTVAVAAGLWLAVSPALRAQPADEGARLQAFFDAQWERGLRESPENASFQGDLRYNDRWTDFSLDAIAAREAADREALAEIRRIDRSRLGPADQLNYDAWVWLQEKTVQRQRFREYLQPISHQGGVQTADGTAESLNFAAAKDYRDWLARMRALPTAIDQVIDLMREGVKTGHMPPRVLMQRVPVQIAAQIVDDPEKSPFYRPFAKFPAGVSEAERDALRAEARQVIAERIVPAYRGLLRYFERDYLPRTRAGIAVADQPEGRAYYDFLASDYTTTRLTADEIHAIGLQEVARIRAEMEKIRTEVGFRGTLGEFFTHLRSDPRFFERDPQALLQRYRAIAKRIDPELVKVFRTIPRQPYGVRPIPDNIAADTTTAYYQQGPRTAVAPAITTSTSTGRRRVRPGK